MVKYRLLLVDTGILIALFELGIWDSFIARCEVHLSETVVEETRFFTDQYGQDCPINLAPYLDRIIIHSVPATRLITLREKLGVTLLEKMDAGEAELLCILDDAPLDKPFLICSADAVVFRYLGATYRSDQGKSLEEILSGIGMARMLDYAYTHKFRDIHTKRGFEQGITGQALNR